MQQKRMRQISLLSSIDIGKLGLWESSVYDVSNFFAFSSFPFVGHSVSKIMAWAVGWRRYGWFVSFYAFVFILLWSLAFVLPLVR